VDRRPGPPWAGAPELRATPGRPGAARLGAPPQGAGRHPGRGMQPHAQAAGGRRHQACGRDERRVWRVRHADAARPGRGQRRPGRHGRPRQAPPTAHARPARPRPRRAARRAPAPAAQDAYPALGGDRARPRRSGNGYRCRRASLRRPASLAGDHPRRGCADGRGHCRRDRRGHDRLWHRSASCCLGGVGQGSGGEAGGMPAEGGLCPANHESAGKQKRRGTRKGNPCLKATLVTAAVCGARTKGTYLRGVVAPIPRLAA